MTSGATERGQIARRAGIVAAGTLFSRLLGLVRDQTIAAVFTRATTDAFFVAFTIPNVLRQVLAEGAVQNAALPVLTAVRENQGEAEARRFFRALRGLSLLILLAVTALGIGFAPGLVRLFAGGFEDIPGQLERTTLLTRWVFPYIFFMGTAALGAAALNANRKFASAAFAPALLNVSFVVLSLLLPSALGARGYEVGLALAVAALLGGALQVLAQWPDLAKIGYLERPSLELRHPAVLEVLRRMGPALFGIGVYAIDVVIARRFLSELGVGAQSYFTWAMRLCDFPQGIFVMAIQTAALPSLSALAARGDLGELARTLAFGLRYSLFVAIPATALFIALAEPLVVLLFQRGEFDAVAAGETARSLVAQGSAVFLVAAVRQLVAAYYALGDTRTPVLVAAADLAVFITLAFALSGPLGHVGVGWAVSGASAVQAVLLFAVLARRLPLAGLGLFLSTLKATLAALGAGAVASGVASLVASNAGDGALDRALPGLAGAAAFAVTFLALAALFRSPELFSIAGQLRRRLLPKP